MCFRSGGQPLGPVDPESHGLCSVVQIRCLVGDKRLLINNYTKTSSSAVRKVWVLMSE